MRFLGRLKNVYRESDVSRIQRAKVGVLIAFIIMGAMFLLVILDFFIMKDYGSVVVEVAVFIFCTIAVIMIYKGKYKFFTYFFITSFLIAAFSNGLLAGKNVNTHFVIYAILFSTLIIATNLGDSVFLLVYTVLASISIYLYSIFFVTYPIAKEYAEKIPEYLEEYVASAITCGVLLFIASGVAILYSTLARDMVRRIIYSEEAQTEKAKKLINIINDIKENFDIVENLNSELNKTNDSVKEISGGVEIISSSSDQLEEVVFDMQKVQENVNSALINVEDKMQIQSLAYNHTYTAMEKMSKAISEMSSSATERIEELKFVSTSVLESVQNLGLMRDSFDGIIDSTRKMMSVMSVIEDISARTNLLAMNASIEAAHAGEAGKGFNVVAQEIRNLAEATVKNSKNITELITGNINKIETVVQLDVNYSKDFQKVVEKIVGITDSLSQIDSGLSNLNEETKKIHDSVENLLSVNDSVNDSTGIMNNMIKKNSASVSKIEETFRSLHDSIGFIADDIVKIRDYVDSLFLIGKDNLKSMELIDKEFDKVVDTNS